MDIYYLDINHYWTCIIWTYTTNEHILLGHKPLLNLYHLDILFGHGPLLDIPYYDEHEP